MGTSLKLIMKPNGDNIATEVLKILNEEGVSQESAPHPKQVLYVEFSEKPERYDILRRQEIDKNSQSRHENPSGLHPACYHT